jgi:predicted dehydrogenase
MTGTRSKVDVPEGNAYEAQMHYFLDCCRNGAKPALCPPADSANAVKVALALKESRAKDGEQVKCRA